MLTSKNDVIVVREGAAFALHKTADADRAQGGDVVGYTLDATNNGNADAEGTETGKDLDGATGALRIDGVAAGPCCCATASRRIPGWSAVRCKPPSPAPGDSGMRRATRRFPIVPAKWPMPTKWPSRCRSQRNQSLRMGFSVRVDDDHAGRVDNVGVLNFHAAASPDGVRMQPSNTVPVMVDGTEGVDLTLVKTHDGNFHAGLEQAYTLKVHAANQPSAGAISVVDTLPDGMQLVSATGPLWTCDAAGQTVSCQTSQTIGPDSPSAPLTLVARVPATVLAGQSAVTLINRAAVSGGGEYGLRRQQQRRGPHRDRSRRQAVRQGLARSQSGPPSPGRGTPPAGARNCCCPTTIRPRGPPACAAWSSAPVRSTAWSRRP